jgi:hypothetical protein
MNDLFKEKLMRKGVLVFFDDIFIYSKTMDEHLKQLEEVLCVLRSNQLFAKIRKASVGVSRIEYLGHVISEKGVSTDPSKIDAMLEWPVPKNIKEFRGFLGLAGYYRGL